MQDCHSTLSDRPSVQKDPLWLTDQWYVAIQSGRLKHRPVRKLIMGIPVVLFRNKSGVVAALLDACPHRNAPLSAGRVAGDLVECPYHGWSFDAAGACRLIPALREFPGKPPARVRSFPVRESQGFVWVFIGETDEHGRDRPPPAQFPCDAGRWSAHFHYEFRFNGGLLPVLENLLDYTHTSFVHQGNFRERPNHPISVTVHRSDDAVDFTFHNERPASGLLFKLLSLGGRRMRHTDRFRLPSIAETIYRFGDGQGFTFFEALTPETHQETRVFGCFTVKLSFPFPAFALENYLRLEGYRLFRQDKWILDLVQENSRHVSPHSPASNKADFYRPHILHLLVSAGKGEIPSGPFDTKIELLA